MKKFYTFVLAACSCIAAGASSPQPAAITEYSPDPLEPAATAPARAASQVADDADYSPWESLGTATLSDGYDNILYTLNNYKGANQEDIVFTNTTEVMTRHLGSDPDVQQFKFCKLFGFTDMIADYDATSGIASIAITATDIPVPEELAEYYGCEEIRFSCTSISYSPVRKVFTFGNPFFYIFDYSGFPGSSFTASLPDARPEIGFNFSLKAGGMKSTDNSITLAVTRTEVDHVRYITRFKEQFLFADVVAVSDGTCDYSEATDEITVAYTEGNGYYRVLALAFDAEDKYMGIYRTLTMFSNLPPEGTWQSAGRGVWHHPDMPSYQIYDWNSGESTTYEFPADKLQWEVEIEKRTDTDREVYRVVNPYSPSCGLADTFNDLLDKMYSGDEAPYRPDAFRTDDTFWFVFDVTEPGKFTIEGGRPNGVGNDHFMGMGFYELSEERMSGATFSDNRLRIPHYSINDLVIDMPGFRGVGFEQIGDADGNIAGSICPATAEVRYVIIPATGEKPADAEFAAEAARVLDGTTAYDVHRIVRSVAEGDIALLPYKDLIEGPAWMLIVPVDNSGEAFDHKVASLSYTKVFSDVTLSECLLAPFYRGDNIYGNFTGLTVTRTTSPDEPDTDVYTLTNPYVNDPGWYDKVSMHRKPTRDWEFVHDRSQGDGHVIMMSSNTGVSLDGVFGSDGDYYLIPRFYHGSRDGEAFSFQLYNVGIEGYDEAFPPADNARVYYTFNIPGSATDGIGGITIDGDDSNAPVEYYDLQGRRVDNPSAGLYIRRQGRHSSKVFVK